MTDPAPLLEVDGIETCYGLSQVLFGLSLTIRAGEMVSLMGRNGMGKTTTIRSIMGLTPARAGAIRLGGQEVRELPSYRIAKLGVGLVPEGRQIFPNLTVRENLIAASANRLNAPDCWTIDNIHALFPRLAERGPNMGNTLSGGEQQMLAIARALATNPRLLLLDEPTEGLAPIIVQELLAALARLFREEGLSAIIVEQHAQKILPITDRAVILERGRIVHQDASATLLADRAPLERFLGVTTK